MNRSSGIVFSTEVCEEYGYLHSDFTESQRADFVLNVDGKAWRSVQHYYQAAKWPARPERAEIIRNTRSAAAARILGRAETIAQTTEARPAVDWGAAAWRQRVEKVVQLWLEQDTSSPERAFNPAAWEMRRVGVMRHAVECKFRQNPALARKLVATGTASIMYRERPMHAETHEFFWGTNAEGQGANMLGQILCAVRAEIKASGPV